MTEPRWLTLARAEIGTLEIKGSKSNPKIIQYAKDSGSPWVADDAVPWCSSFVGAMLARAGIKGTGSMTARSWETWGQRLERPALGCIGVKRRAGANAQAWQGHVGLVVAANPTTVWMIGGNQADSVNIQPFSRWQFTAWRWPDDEPLTDEPLPSTAPGKPGSEA